MKIKKVVHILKFLLLTCCAVFILFFGDELFSSDVVNVLNKVRITLVSLIAITLIAIIYILAKELINLNEKSVQRFARLTKAFVKVCKFLLMIFFIFYLLFF